MNLTDELRKKHQDSDGEWRRKHQNLEDEWRRKHQVAEDQWRQRHMVAEEEWRDQHNTAMREKDQLRFQMEQLQEATSSEARTRQEVLSKHQAVDGELSRVQADLQALQAKCNEHVSSKEAAIRQHQALQQDIGHLRKDFLDLKASLAEEQIARQEAERKHKVVERDMQLLHVDIQRLQVAREEQSKDRINLQASLKKQETTMQQVIKEKEDQIRDLLSQRESERDQLSSSFERKIKKHSTEVEALRQQFAASNQTKKMLEDDVAHLNRARSEREKACEDLRLSLDSEQKEHRMLKAEYERVKNERDLKVGKAQLQKDVTSSRKLSAEISTIQEEVTRRSDHGHPTGYGERVIVNLSEEMESMPPVNSKTSGAKRFTVDLSADDSMSFKQTFDLNAEATRSFVARESISTVSDFDVGEIYNIHG